MRKIKTVFREWLAEDNDNKYLVRAFMLIFGLYLVIAGITCFHKIAENLLASIVAFVISIPMVFFMSFILTGGFYCVGMFIKRLDRTERK